ncbi:hypothetical protein LCGC14_1072720 [marine sediment metagenome]|uniref:Uncharacterized protein n=1 Tax=marine sediment metagenome TaxID=412755 RepID=A0A0F9MHL9_9ZZZZ
MLEDSTPICRRCGLTCEIAHKARRILLSKESGEHVYYHDANALDCYEQARAAGREAFYTTRHQAVDALLAHNDEGKRC